MKNADVPEVQSTLFETERESREAFEQFAIKELGITARGESPGWRIWQAALGWKAAHPQPAPDVAALVDALEASAHRLHVQPDGEDDCRCSQCRFVRLRDAALAAHRKQQEPSHDNQQAEWGET